MSESRHERLARIHRLLAEKEFRRLAWRWLRPAPKVYSSVRVFVNGVELEEVTSKWEWRR